MDRNDRRSRRSTLQLVAGAAGIALAAGCTDGTGEGEGNPEQNESDETVTNETDEDDPDPPESGPDDEWEVASTIELEADTDGWIGRQPAAIDGEENPDLALYDGREYEFLLTNEDGDVHNLAIWDESEPIASSAFVEAEGETETLVVEATAEMEQYLCETHEDEMAGAVEIRTE